ncbi:fumarate hydratase, partial [Achromobacter ruhlandii]|uniref:fumarate hydratase n=1 Tax=Achromobacter ruhlandii TaxID=72557 RepID=UPI003211B725
MAPVWGRRGGDARVRPGGPGPTPGRQGRAGRAGARAYGCAAKPLRASMVRDPLGLRRNTRDNTPSALHAAPVAGAGPEFTAVATGRGGDGTARPPEPHHSDPLPDGLVAHPPALCAAWRRPSGRAQAGGGPPDYGGLPRGPPPLPP